MNLFLHRLPTARCTLGLMHAAGEKWTLFTLERPWKDNAPNISCVPHGVYSLEPHSTGPHPETWALVGASVSHWPAEAKARFAILFDVANFVHELQGCIALGMGARVHREGFRTVDSAEAMDVVRESLAKHDLNTLSITGG